MNNLRQIGVAAQMAAEDNHGRLPASLDDLSNTLGTRAVLTDTISGKPFVYIAGGKDLKTLSSNAVLAYSPENKNGRAVLFADGRVALVANGDFDVLTNQTPVEFALADKVAREDLAKTAVNAPAVAAAPPPASLGAAATPPAAPTVAGEFEMQKPGVTASQAFVQTGVAANQQNLYRNVSTAAQTAPVLQSFQVLQNGDAISVVDRDGSVYQGSVQVAAAERNQSAPVEAPPQSHNEVGSIGRQPTTAGGPKLFLPRDGNEPDIETERGVQRQCGGDSRCDHQRDTNFWRWRGWRRRIAQNNQQVSTNQVAVAVVQFPRGGNGGD